MRFLASLLLAVPLAAFGQGWKPTKEVEFVIPFAVGGGADLLARVIHKIITEEKMVPVPVALVNKPGGGGAAGIGYMSAARKADPNTLVLINGSTQITPIITPAAKTVSEVQPIMNVMLDDFVFFVRADAPWKSLKDFLSDAKAKGPKSMAFSAGGTTVNPGDLIVGDADGVVVLRKEEAEQVIAGAQAKVDAEVARAKEVKEGKLVMPWVIDTLRKVGVIGPNEQL